MKKCSLCGVAHKGWDHRPAVDGFWWHFGGYVMKCGEIFNGFCCADCSAYIMEK